MRLFKRGSNWWLDIRGEGHGRIRLKVSAWQRVARERAQIIEVELFKRRAEGSGAVERYLAGLKRRGQGKRGEIEAGQESQALWNSTVGEYYERWITTKAPPLARASRVRSYRQCFQCYILPTFGEVRLRELIPRMLVEFQSALISERRLSVKTVRNIIDGSFRAMVREAREVDGIIERDPFASVKWPRLVLEPPDPFTEEERDTILGYFEKRRRDQYGFPLFLFWTGTRPSEATALRWKDIDPRLGTADIRRSRHLGEEAATKTRASQRTIKLTSDVVEVLSAAKPLRATSEDHIFLNLDGGDSRSTPMSGENSTGKLRCESRAFGPESYTLRATPSSRRCFPMAAILNGWLSTAGLPCK